MAFLTSLCLLIKKCRIRPRYFVFQDPYHGPGQAMGLSFSVPEGVKVPSSLVNIFKELQKDLGCSIPSHGNLEKWAIQVKYIYENVEFEYLLIASHILTNISLFFFLLIYYVVALGAWWWRDTECLWEVQGSSPNGDKKLAYQGKKDYLYKMHWYWVVVELFLKAIKGLLLKRWSGWGLPYVGIACLDPSLIKKKKLLTTYTEWITCQYKKEIQNKNLFLFLDITLLLLKHHFITMD